MMVDNLNIIIQSVILPHQLENVKKLIQLKVEFANILLVMDQIHNVSDTNYLVQHTIDASYLNRGILIKS